MTFLNAIFTCDADQLDILGAETSLGAKPPKSKINRTPLI